MRYIQHALAVCLMLSSFIIRYSPGSCGRIENNELLIVIGQGYCSLTLSIRVKNTQSFSSISSVAHNTVQCKEYTHNCMLMSPEYSLHHSKWIDNHTNSDSKRAIVHIHEILWHSKICTHSLLKVSSTSLSVACQQMASLSDLDHGSTFPY